MTQTRTPGPVRVLVVEDSAVQRKALVAMLEDDPELTVVGWAANGADAVRETARLKPDVIAMDLRMPVMDGLEATRRILQETPTPIVMVTSSAGPNEKRLAFEAIDAGVLAVLAKPSIGSEGAAGVRELSRMLKNMARVRVLRRWSDGRMGTAGRAFAPAPPPVATAPQGSIELVVIGASTGGPQALREVLVDLPSRFRAPVLVVQHIAVGFADGLVDWLRPLCHLPIQIAADGQALDRPGISVAPPGQHLVVRGHALALIDGPPRSLHRPSATVLFQSAAHEYGRSAIGVLLSGMGDDGALGMSDLKRAGAITIAQDEATSVVFSMPASAIRLGVVDYVVPPTAMAALLIQQLGS